MDVDQLNAAMSAHDPDVEAVLRTVRAKQHARRRRWLVLGAGVVTGLLLVSAAALLRRDDDGPSRPAPAPPAQVADGCASMPLGDTLANAKSAGASIVIARATLTGRSAQDGLVYDELALHSVRTISGPAVAADSAGWVSGAQGPAGPVPGADAGALWASDGWLFAIAWPRAVTNTTVGPILRIAPLVDNQVILSSAGCWDATGLSTQPFTGRLAEIPGSNSYARAAAGGFKAVPLTTLEALAK
jgi:hypothetical protein